MTRPLYGETCVLLDPQISPLPSKAVNQTEICNSQGITKLKAEVTKSLLLPALFVIEEREEWMLHLQPILQDCPPFSRIHLLLLFVFLPTLLCIIIPNQFYIV